MKRIAAALRAARLVYRRRPRRPAADRCGRGVRHAALLLFGRPVRRRPAPGGRGARQGTTTAAFVLDLAGPNHGKITPVGHADGQPMSLTELPVVGAGSGGVLDVRHRHAGWPTGAGPAHCRGQRRRHRAISSARRDTRNQAMFRQYDGQVIDWRNGVDGKVLMARTHLPDPPQHAAWRAGRRPRRRAGGYAHRQGRHRRGPEAGRRGLCLDGRGNVRMMARGQVARRHAEGVPSSFSTAPRMTALEAAGQERRRQHRHITAGDRPHQQCRLRVAAAERTQGPVPRHAGRCRHQHAGVRLAAGGRGWCGAHRA